MFDGNLHNLAWRSDAGVLLVTVLVSLLVVVKVMVKMVRKLNSKRNAIAQL